MLAAACREPAPPSLATLGPLPGSARAQAKAYLRVALLGKESERRRAALLWGLAAAESGSPCSAVTAFRVAAPPGGRARLAARRLTAALARDQRPELWCRAASLPWLQSAERDTLVVGAVARAGPLLPPCVGDEAELAGEARLQLLASRARGTEAAATGARRSLAVEFPARFGEVLAGQDLDEASESLTTRERAMQAAAWLAADEPERALRAARRAGAAAAATAARACLRLRRLSEAVTWTGLLAEDDAEGWLLRAEAQRRIAWVGTPSDRTRPLRAQLLAAERAHRLARSAEERGQAGILAAEALVELGQLREAGTWLSRPEVVRQPRAEWVLRRRLLLDRRAPALPGGAAVSTRVLRLDSLWRGVREGDAAALEALAGGGFPDLPALWASQRLRRAGVAVVVGAEVDAALPSPPPWAGELLAFGRTADALLAWRAELEEGGVTGAEWLSFLRAAQLPPLDAIPLLIKAERRLLSGPWQGLDRSLLERYLPLPWRGELERAAQRSSVPPWVLAGVVRQESAWNARALSAAGAVGLSQVVPGTAGELRRRVPEWTGGAAALFDPAINLTVGAMLLARWRADFAGSWPAALAAYNSGERRTREVWERCGRRDGAEFVESLEIPETWDYVHRVVLLAEGYRLLYWPEGKAYPWT